MNATCSQKDIRFRDRFEACEVPPSQFSHRAHLRLAYVYLCENDPETSIMLMKEALLRFLRHNSIDPKHYHQTLTSAWILAVHHFMNKATYSDSAESLVSQFPQMQDSEIMKTHYSSEKLFSNRARLEFVQPDLDPIPRYY